MAGEEQFSREVIQREYERLGYKLGWRFLYGPETTLHEAEIALITLNPAGCGIEPNHPDWSRESGSAYVQESWKGKLAGTENLQVQILRLLSEAQVRPDDTLAGCYVPFRSPRWCDLAKKDEALKFGDRLWSWALKKSGAKRIVVLGQTAGGLTRRVAHLIDAKIVDEVSTRWGLYKMRRYVSDDGRTLISLPHLSTFKIFGRGNGFDSDFQQAISPKY